MNPSVAARRSQARQPVRMLAIFEKAVLAVSNRIASAERSVPPLTLAMSTDQRSEGKSDAVTTRSDHELPIGNRLLIAELLHTSDDGRLLRARRG
jgi:hypothetical protein